MKTFSDHLLNIVKGRALYSGRFSDAFREITETAAEALQIERASIWIYSEDRLKITCADLFNASSTSHSSGAQLFKKELPNYFAALEEDRVIDASDAHTDARTSEFSNEYLPSLGIASMLDAPIRWGGELIGVICLEHVGEVRNWTLDEATFSGSLADLVSHAVEANKRTVAESALQESERRFRDYAQSCAEWFWESDGAYRITEVHSYDPDESPDDWKALIGSQVENLAIPTQSQSGSEWDELQRQLATRQRFQDFRYGREVDQQIKWISISGVPVFDKRGQFSGYRGVGIDVTDEVVSKQALAFIAAHDYLTELPNRRSFEKEIAEVLSEKGVTDCDKFLLYIDLDRFKIINDSCGHDVGNEALVDLSRSLLEMLEPDDVIYHLGSDEFAILYGSQSLNDATNRADYFRKQLELYRFETEGRIFDLTLSGGLLKLDASISSPSEALKRCELACFLAKEAGGNLVRHYTPEDVEISGREKFIDDTISINHALRNHQFVLYGQLLAPLKPELKPSFEVLVRMQADDGTIVPPGSFLPAAERFNLIQKIDRWVVDEAFRFIRQHETKLSGISHLSINLSGPSVSDPKFLNFVVDRLDEYQIDSELVCFEITETAAIRNLMKALSFIRTLKGMGCTFALDDFGSGLSSFAYLKSLPVDYIKIDGMFIQQVMEDPVSRVIVSSINQVAAEKSAKTVGEFVETEEVKAVLSELGIDYAQGYGIGIPRPLDECFEL